MPTETPIRVHAPALTDLCIRALQKLGVCEDDARLTADICVQADLRGVASHGVAHLRRYIRDLQAGVIVARPEERVLCETRATATIDAGAGLGQPAGHRAMQRAIQKACDVGAGFVAVRNSNHYGIAGYYAMLALEHDCIGFSTTNGSPMVVPTFGRTAMLGTNPIAVAAPAGVHRPFVLDMATSAVSLGKLEIADRLDKPIPVGWALGANGLPAEDPGAAIRQFWQRAGGGLLPLGGEGEQTSGYKGYGLGLWMDILSAVLSGAAHANLTYPRRPDGIPLPSNVGHFFGAWRIDAFRPLDEFTADMDDLQALLKNAPRAEGHERIYIHGEKEYEAEERHLREGIPLDQKLAADLRALAGELQIDYNLE